MRIGRRSRGILSVLAATLLLSGLSVGPVVTQETKSAPDSLSEAYGPWVLNCGAELTGCHVVQALFRAKDKARLVQVTVLASSESNPTQMMRALVPLGATLSEGVVVEIDAAAPQTVVFQACWPRGCIAEFPLTPELEADLRAGETLAVSVQGADTGRTIRFELALAGFGAALDRLRGL